MANYRINRLPFEPNHRLVVVRGTLNRRADVRLLVDTGAQAMMISRQIAQSLALDTNQPARYQRLVGVGQSPPVPVVRLDQMQVGACVVERLEAYVYDLAALFGVDGILGLPFLRRFRVTFEFDRRMLVLREPPVASSRPSPDGTADTR